MKWFPTFPAFLSYLCLVCIGFKWTRSLFFLLQVGDEEALRQFWKLTYFFIGNLLLLEWVSTSVMSASLAKTHILASFYVLLKSFVFGQCAKWFIDNVPSVCVQCGSLGSRWTMKQRVVFVWKEMGDWCAKDLRMWRLAVNLIIIN